MQPFKYKPNINSGRLRHRVAFFKPPSPDDVDEVGQPLDDWVFVKQTWASIEPLRGREFFSAMQVNADVTTRIRIRYQDDIDRTMTVKYGNTEFEILYIIHTDYAQKELQIMCRERQ